MCIRDRDGGDRSVRVNFERVKDKVKITGVKLLQKRVDENNIDTKINSCREGEYIENFDSEMSNINDAVWEIRADEFCSGGEVVRSGQHAAFWQVIEQFKGVFVDVPGLSLIHI